MEDALRNLGWERDHMRLGFIHRKAKQFISQDELEMMNPDKLVATLVNRSKPPAPLPLSPGTEQDDKFVYPDEHKLKVRLGIRPTDKLPFDKIMIVRGTTKLHLVVVFDKCNKITVIEDDPVLFPTDELVGKLRMHPNF
jgi:hypothetical protein